MSQLNRKRHQTFRLFAGIAEHHPLVSGTGIQHLICVLSFDPACNIGRLCMQIYIHTAAIRIEASPGLCIAYFTYNLSCNLLIVKPCIRGNLSENVNLLRGRCNLTGDVGFRVLS